MDLARLGGDKREDLPQFNVGDTVKVSVRIVEGGKERLQVFEGAVIARKGHSNLETFTVRKISFGIGVEKVFFLHSPAVGKIEVTRRGRTARAKLYYLRQKIGKERKISEARKQIAGR
jgi:large subunit ribosomal protein L19